MADDERMGDTQQRAADLLRQVAEMREELLQERSDILTQREVLNARLTEIDLALGALPDSAKAALQKLEPPAKAGQDQRTAPEIVLSILEAKPDLIGPQIVNEGRRVRQDLEPTTWYAALYRLEKRGDIVATGTRGNRIYRLARHGKGDEPSSEKT